MPERDTIPIARLQTADQALGRLACALLQPLRWKRRWLRLRPSCPDRILAIKFWGIGSLQLLTPAVRALRERSPGARIDLLTLRENEAFARSLGVFDEVRTIDVATASWSRLLARLYHLVRALRRSRYGEVIDFEFFTHFSAIVTALSGAPRTRGFAAPGLGRGRFHRATVPFNRYWHVARNFRLLAAGRDSGDVTSAELTPPRVTSAARERVARVLGEHGIEATSGFVVLNANAGRLSLERRWPAERFAELARRLVTEDGLRVVLVGAPAERAHVARVAALARPLPHGFLLDLAGELSIDELVALLERANAVVSNDSGPMHVAAALETPTVGLFGPETPVMYAPLGTRARALWEPPICSPCINVHDNKLATCIHGRPECLLAIGVEAVLDETRRALWDGVLHAVPRAAMGAALAREGPVA